MSVRPVNFITIIVRNASTKPVTNNDISPYLYNRNPRNLERMRLDRKPGGYYLNQVFVEYWHKLELKPKKHHVEAHLVHNTNKVVVLASTSEWAIYKHLYSKTDSLAYITLAKVFAERCLESGINCFAKDVVPSTENTKLNSFLKTLLDEGLTFYEPPQFDIHKVWYLKREKRPWMVLENQDK